MAEAAVAAREAAVAASREAVATGTAAEAAVAGAGAGAGGGLLREEASGQSLFQTVLGRAAASMHHQQIKGLMGQIDGAILAPAGKGGDKKGGGMASGTEAAISRFLDHSRTDAAKGRVALERGDSGDTITGLAKLVRVSAMAHLYNAACEQRGVPPVARILSQLGSRHLALRYYNLGPRGAAPLAIVLGTNAYWRSLDLSDNCLAPQACSLWLHSLWLHSPWLHSLWLRSSWLHLLWLYSHYGQLCRRTSWGARHGGASVSRGLART